MKKVLGIGLIASVLLGACGMASLDTSDAKSAAEAARAVSGEAAYLVNGGTYNIAAWCSGKVVDVSEVSKTAGANVHQWDYVGGENQKWKLQSAGDGSWYLVSAWSGMALDGAGWGTADRTNVIQWHLGNNQANQKWRIDPNGDGSYRLTNVHANKVLDVNASSTQNGGNIQLYTWNGTNAQRWTFTRLDSSASGVARPGEVPADLWSYMVSAASKLGMSADFAWYVASVCRHESLFGAWLTGSSPSIADGLMQVQGPTRDAYSGSFASAFGHGYNHGSPSDQIAMGALILKDMIVTYAGGNWKIGAMKYNGGPYYVPGSVDIYGRPIYAEQYAAEVMAVYWGYGGTHQ